VHGRARPELDDEELAAQEEARRSGGNVRLARPRRQRTGADAPSPSRPRRYGDRIDLGEENMDTQALRALLEDILFDNSVIGETPIGSRWRGGTLIMKPGVEGQQSKEVPIETLFHKVVMVRDRLRVLEQKINSSKNLDDTEKVDMQQYITRCYGSLTTFNILFADKSDQFQGSKG